MNEILHTMRTSTSRIGYMALKIDLEKAFDRLNWDFIREVLFELGLPSSFVSLVMFCVTSPTMALLWQGSPSSTFSPSRGLRQGDSLFTFLFILAMEKLGHLIQAKVLSKDWKPIKTSKLRLSISHLFNADDLFPFCSGFYGSDATYPFLSSHLLPAFWSED